MVPVLGNIACCKLEFYSKVTKSLRSLGTVGSIWTENGIKPLKHIIMTKKSNILSDPKEVVLVVFVLGGGGRGASYD